MALNRAIAIGEVDGPVAALAAMDEIADELDSYYLLHSARATMLRRLGDDEAAGVAFRRALELAPTEKDRRFLERQLSG